MKLKKYLDQKNNRLAGKLLSYAGMSGAFLAATGSANGQVVYTDVDPDTVLMGGTLTIDMDNDLMPDYSIQQFGLAGQNVGAKFSAPSANLSNEFIGSVGAFGYYYPSVLAAGAPINTAGNFLIMANAPGYEPSLVFAYATGAVYGNWNGQSGFVGVHFFSGGSDYYGWIELEVATGGLSITLKSYAYESTPATPILAGDTGAAIGINTPANEPADLNAGRIAPNPVSDGQATITVEALRAKDITLEIFNGMGSLVASEVRFVKSGKNRLVLDIPTLAGGSYFVKISDESTSLFRKLVIAH